MFYVVFYALEYFACVQCLLRPEEGAISSLAGARLSGTDSWMLPWEHLGLLEEQLIILSTEPSF